jgi:hypothetical protein
MYGPGARQLLAARDGEPAPDDVDGPAGEGEDQGRLGIVKVNSVAAGKRLGAPGVLRAAGERGADFGV